MIEFADHTILLITIFNVVDKWTSKKPAISDYIARTKLDGATSKIGKLFHRNQIALI